MSNHPMDGDASSLPPTIEDPLEDQNRSLRPEPMRRALPKADAGIQLLLGMLALQHNFVDRETLLGAFNVWVVEKSRGIGPILVDRGKLSPQRMVLLESLADELLSVHGDDLSKSLASRETLTMLRGGLGGMGDLDLDTTLNLLSNQVDSSHADPDATTAGPNASSNDSKIRFRLLKSHAEGGQGEVWLAQDEELNRKVAFKCIKKQYAADPSYQARLLIEAEVTGRLEHPGFVPVHDVGLNAQGHPFYVMRFIDGESLRDRINKFHEAEKAGQTRSRRTMALRGLLEHFISVCESIAYAHMRGMLHRDIKPSNILVGHFGETYLVDWGLAKYIGKPDGKESTEETLRPIVASGSVHTQGTVGTLGYMSPEQLDGKGLAPSSDIYSLGVTLYALLVGKMAFPGRVAEIVENHIKTGRFARPREANPKVSRVLEAICLKAMATKPEDRYAGSKDLADDLRHWLADEPVYAYPEPTSRRVLRWARHHKPVVFGGLAFLVMALVGLLTNDIMLRQKQQETEQARLQSARNFRSARKAVYELVELAAKRLPQIAGTESIGKDIGEKALKITRDFADRAPSDPSVQFDLARVLRVAANIGRQTGEFDEPLARCREAEKILNRLVDQDPLAADAIKELALLFVDLGELLRMNGRPGAAKVEFQKTLDLLREPGGSPAAGGVTGIRAIALLDLANLCNETGAYDDARRIGEQAIDTLPKKTDLHALAMGNLGITLRELGDRAAAESIFQTATKEMQELVNRSQSPDNIRLFAVVRSDHAELIAFDPARWSEAREQFSQAAEMLTDLTAKSPRNPIYQRDLATALNGLGGVSIALSRRPGTDPVQVRELDAQAQRNCEKARAILNELIARNLPEDHSQLGRTLANLGQIAIARGQSGADLFAQARAEHRIALKLNPESAVDQKFLDRLDAQIDPAKGSTQNH